MRYALTGVGVPGVAMTWTNAKQSLQAAITYVKENPFLDAGVEVLLGEVPVVGGFLTKLYAKAKASGEEDKQVFLQILKGLATHEDRFDRIAEQVSAQGDALTAGLADLSTVAAIVADVPDKLSEINANLTDLSGDMADIKALTRTRAVADAFQFAATLEDDTGRRSELIGRIQTALEEAGHEGDAETVHQLGLFYQMTGQEEMAEAAFLHAIDMDQSLSAAYISLSGLYQMRANTFILQENYGFAEIVMDKAQLYLKAADDPLSAMIDIQLGYNHKEMAQRLRQSQPDRAKTHLEQARIAFTRALAIAPDDPSAENGMGSLLMLDGDYDGAVGHVERAIALSPGYVAAYFDLAQVRYALYRQEADPKEQAVHQLEGLKAYMGVLELAQNGVHLPPDAQAHLDRIYQPMIATLNAKTL